MRRRINQRRRAHRGHVPLRMTSMMDILTVLLLFLLKSFVVDPEVVTPASGLTLPESTSETALQESIVLAIVGDSVNIGGEVVARVDIVDESTLFVDSLALALEEARADREAISQLRGEDEAEELRVTIQGDHEMPFLLLQKVMFTCNQSGFDDISLAVLRTS